MTHILTDTMNLSDAWCNGHQSNQPYLKSLHLNKEGSVLNKARYCTVVILLLYVILLFLYSLKRSV